MNTHTHMFCFKKKTHTQLKHVLIIGYPALTLGPNLPSNNCELRCVFYFNVLGNEDPLSVVLVAFVTNGQNVANVLFLNKNNNSWDYLPTHGKKLAFNVHERPWIRGLPNGFGHTFLVCL